MEFLENSITPNPSNAKTPIYKNKKVLVTVLFLFITIWFWWYQNFVKNGWTIPNINIKQEWNTSVKVNTITWDVNSFSDTESAIKTIVSKLNDGFKNNYATISKYEVVKDIQLKDNFTLVHMTISPSSDKDVLEKYFRFQLEKSGKEIKDIDELVKRLKETGAYDKLAGNLNETLKQNFWKVMDKGMYMVIEKKWDVLIPQKVGDYIEMNYNNSAFTQSEYGWFLVMKDYLNYQGVYKSTNQNIWDMLSISQDQRKVFTRDNFLEIMVSLTGKNTNYWELSVFLSKLKPLYE